MPNNTVRGQITDKNGGSVAGFKVIAYHFMIRVQTETKRQKTNQQQSSLSTLHTKN
jgi:hypothetical protein